MTREIKFRVWDGEKMRFAQLGDSSMDDFNDMLKYQLEDSDSGEFTTPVMQFTGLKDKTGREIYEGDKFDMGVVIFSRGCFNGCYISGSTNERGWDYSDDWEDGLENYARNHEIIGNIYENKDLLNNQ